MKNYQLRFGNHFFKKNTQCLEATESQGKFSVSSSAPSPIDLRYHLCVKHYSATTNAKTFKKKRKKGQALFAPASKSISPAGRVSQSLTLIPVSSALLSSRPPSPAPPQARLPQLPGPLPPAAHPSGPASSVLWLILASPRLPEDVPIEKREQKAPFAVSPRRRGASSFEEPAKEGKGPALKNASPAR